VKSSGSFRRRRRRYASPRRQASQHDSASVGQRMATPPCPARPQPFTPPAEMPFAQRRIRWHARRGAAASVPQLAALSVQAGRRNERHRFAGERLRQCRPQPSGACSTTASRARERKHKPDIAGEPVRVRSRWGNVTPAAPFALPGPCHQRRQPNAHAALRETNRRPSTVNNQRRTVQPERRQTQ